MLIEMKTSELDFDLPDRLIAERPVEPRDASRLLVVDRKTGAIEHRFFKDLPSYLEPGDLLVLNRAKVVPARCPAVVDGQKRIVEILVLNAGGGHDCQAMLKPSKKVRNGSCLKVRKTGAAFTAQRMTRSDYWSLRLVDRQLSWNKLLELEGEMPLPPYILKKRGQNSALAQDPQWYQTVFADREGAIAAPTAGLHFSKELLGQIQNRGIGIASVFLKVGLGTFKPIKTEEVRDHPMHEEEYEIDSIAEEKIDAARRLKKRVVAVGTTVVRTLESNVELHGKIKASVGNTKLMILPPYSFRGVDALITNFHLPRSTLLGLVYAFGGIELVRKAYGEAIREHYRFFSYGDAMLIL
jgi:S-adenosylmethionine:tRNA ribosyltransferase-isomerase